MSLARRSSLSLLALLALNTLACDGGSPSDPPDPCAGVTCSGHGACQVTGGLVP